MCPEGGALAELKIEAEGDLLAAALVNKVAGRGRVEFIENGIFL